MFVVYSPEGQSIAASAQQLPVLRVDPSTRINQVTDSSLQKLDVDERLPNRQTENKKLSAYKKNAANAERHVVVKVAEVMSHPVITIEFNSSIAQAFERMERLQIDYLPIVKADVLIGICNRETILKKIIVDDEGDILQGGGAHLKNVMIKQVVATSFDTDIRQVAQVFSQYHVGAIVITGKDERLMGVVTQGDLVRRLAQEPPIELYI